MNAQLTVYLMQSVIGVWLFYGYMPGPDWFGNVGPLLLVPIFLVIFTAQILFSRWWLGRYRFGPTEWLWRSLTYGRLQPMRVEVPSGGANTRGSCAGHDRNQTTGGKIMTKRTFRNLADTLHLAKFSDRARPRLELGVSDAQMHD